MTQTWQERGANKSRRKRAWSRKGAVIVESAILLPAFILISFAAIEACNYMYLRQSLAVAGFEAAMVCSDSQGSEAAAATRCTEILEARGVTSHTLSVSPTVDAFTAAGTKITVTVSAPASAYQIGPLWFFQGATVSSTVVMVRT